MYIVQRTQLYLGNLQERQNAMRALVGTRKGRHEFEDSEAYVRSLRRGARLERIVRLTPKSMLRG